MSSIKIRIVTLVSDMGILQSVPIGRLDFLSKTFDSTPEFFKAAVDVMPKKGSAAWRNVKDFIVMGNIPHRKQRQRRPSNNTPHKKRISISHGCISFSKAFEKELYNAGLDFSSNKDIENAESCMFDLVEGQLALEGIDKENPFFGQIIYAAAEVAYEGFRKGVKNV